jgi:CRISPR-associated exonuclease Cas4
MEIDRAWAENYFVSKANIIHERAHSASQYASRGKKVYTAVKVWNDDYGLFGITDCIEERNGQYTIVEYKPTTPKSGTVRDEDAMQIFAQKICVDHVFSTDCSAEIYYADTKKRYPLPFQEEYKSRLGRLSDLLREMQAYRQAGIIPPIRNGQVCSGCSMKDLCIPSAHKRHADVKDLIIRFSEDEL